VKSGAFAQPDNEIGKKMEFKSTIKWLLEHLDLLVAIAGSLLSAVIAVWGTSQSNKNHQTALDASENARREDAKAAQNLLDDERLLRYSLATLERSYLALHGPTPDVAIPPLDRLNWLTSARLILAYREAKAGIKDTLLRKECDNQEDYWREKYYLLLEPLAKENPEYFTNLSTERWKSAAIIVHSFAEWPKNKKDLLDDYHPIDSALHKLPINPIWANLKTVLDDEKTNPNKEVQPGE
jgi:hypothetical protein